ARAHCQTSLLPEIVALPAALDPPGSVALGSVPAMVILVLSPRLTEGRRAAFRALTQGLGEIRFAIPGGPPADIAECDAIVVDGSIALRTFAAVVETPRGAGRVVACGLGNTDAALRTPELAQLLTRALRPDLHCCGRNIGVGIVGYGPLGAMGYHHGLGVIRT